MLVSESMYRSDRSSASYIADSPCDYWAGTYSCNWTSHICNQLNNCVMKSLLRRINLMVNFVINIESLLLNKRLLLMSRNHILMQLMNPAFPFASVSNFPNNLLVGFNIASVTQNFISIHPYFCKIEITE